ncbi:MAG TPA: hypothetical protein VFG21_03355 [Xanthomonadaceae bacterium]|nr:hypothetical protein [Xanthomonadaceae bacterium]
METLLLLSVALVAPVAAFVAFRIWSAHRRERALRRLLDRADALEKLLVRTRERMQAMKQVVRRVPSDIAAEADASLDAGNRVQQALRNVLEHRLWIARHGATASHAELVTAERALQRSHARIADQLERLESAGADLADVTRQALEQAAREPPELRRGDVDGTGDGHDR